MAKHVGVKLPDDLIAVLKRGQTVATLATFSEKGLPHAMPVQYIYPKGLESILLTINKDLPGYHNMVWQKKVILSFLEEGNVAYTILGRAGVVRAPSIVHPLMNVVRIDIIDIYCDKSSLVKIESGVRWSHTSADAQELSDSLMNELKELSQTL
jgi:hypothetical protein